jgi:hypothetical protein
MQQVPVVRHATIQKLSNVQQCFHSIQLKACLCSFLADVRPRIACFLNDSEQQVDRKNVLIVGLYKM